MIDLRATTEPLEASMIRTYTVLYNRATNHINGLDELAKGSELNYSLSACSAVTKGYLAAGESFSTVAEALANAVLAGGRRLCKNCEKAAKAALAKEELLEAERARMIAEAELEAYEIAEAMYLEELEALKPLDEARAAEVKLYTLTVRYQVTTAPFAGRVYETPMKSANKLLGDIWREIAEGLGLDAKAVEILRIEILDDPNTTAEIPTSFPTKIIAPGIYTRPIIVKNTGLECLYSIGWARIIDRGLVYRIRRATSLGHSKTVAENLTAAEAQSWLDDMGMEIMPEPFTSTPTPIRLR
jgi:hypothetical protein